MLEICEAKSLRLLAIYARLILLMFSEYYFYLTAFLRDVNRETRFDNKDDLYPTSTVAAARRRTLQNVM